MTDHESSNERDDVRSIRRHRTPGSSITETIIAAVEELRNGEPTSEPRLYDAIDPDALNALLTPARSRNNHPTTVSFVFDRYTVTANSSGEVRIGQVDE